MPALDPQISSVRGSLAVIAAELYLSILSRLKRYIFFFNVSDYKSKERSGNIYLFNVSAQLLWKQSC